MDFFHKQSLKNKALILAYCDAHLALLFDAYNSNAKASFDNITKHTKSKTNKCNQSCKQSL
ncbi:hypothetical protein [Campylobacter sp.]|uniref:hypothetical protein n=1 Tax=Campylobacter sp. TaxID=205 RepID=UPI002A828EE7|nr:hypothetical protein [Campylobacter sp.]